ncbi:putative phospholipase B-like lamina ancestor [Cimex lectularius]|uniref:Phospholipase B-like n=1 Tax=Cimex lectularius TaxID=79782 RepID=A0A8I6TEL1_CIMLE|nr:putative phospholipase B-like lamina ancestor [Cimex lectularius]XP_014244251.1 putative phospholipase B-like lamina ancestor [Cimex lectularius]XP_014244252.1 putative phospholipase B-like lamina ancestor [Cimex lectularius]
MAMLKVVGASWEQTRLTFFLLGVVGIMAVIAIFFYEIPVTKNDGFYAATVYWKQGSNFRVRYWGQNNDPTQISPGVARAYYREDSSHTGWATLEIQTTPSYPDWVQAYAAGLLEGSLCWRMIYWHWQNTVANTCKNREEFCDKIRRKVLENAEKMKAEAKIKDATDAYWHQVNMFYTQLAGLEEGWKNGVSRSRKEKIFNIPHVDFIWMNSASDLRDLEFQYNVTKSYDPASPANSIALLKYLPNSMPNFILAHEAAGYYSEMLRVQKKYSFNFHYTSHSDSLLVPGNTTIFTSYPGSLYSQDDFYHVLGKNNLTIAGSSIKNYNNSLWDKVNLENLMLGPRVVAANRLSKNAKTWTKIMSRNHSGTGNKQWLVVETVQGMPKLWVLEQMPGITVSRDMSKIWYNYSYWVSYGVPYFEEVRNVSGYDEEGDGVYMVNRMKIVLDVLSKGQKDVVDEETMVKLMRHPEITALGRSDIFVLNITGDMTYQMVDDTGFSVHYNPHKIKNQSHAHFVANQVSEESAKGDHDLDVHNKGFQDMFNGMINGKGPNDRLKDIRWPSTGNKVHRVHAINEDPNDSFREYDGLIDLKISLGHAAFKAAAGPPYTEYSDTVKVAPFQWSKTSLKSIPHYGQGDKWEFTPTLEKWVW